jgi:hypothetical protein
MWRVRYCVESIGGPWALCEHEHNTEEEAAECPRVAAGPEIVQEPYERIFPPAPGCEPSEQWIAELERRRQRVAATENNPPGQIPVLRALSLRN